MGSPKVFRVAVSHEPAIPSSQAVRNVFPSGLNATARTAPGCTRGSPASSPPAATHSRAERSSLPVRIDRPSGLKATARTAPTWSIAGPTGSPVAVSHRRAVASIEPPRMVIPSGLKAAARMGESCMMGSPRRSPLAASQSLDLPGGVIFRPGGPGASSKARAFLRPENRWCQAAGGQDGLAVGADRQPAHRLVGDQGQAPTACRSRRPRTG